MTRMILLCWLCVSSTVFAVASGKLVLPEENWPGEIWERFWAPLGAVRDDFSNKPHLIVVNGAGLDAEKLKELRAKSPQSRILIYSYSGNEAANGELKKLAVADQVDFLPAPKDYPALAETLLPPVLRIMAKQELRYPTLAECKAEAVIVLPPDAAGPERHAATELQYFFSGIYGCTPEIVAEAPADAPAFLLGDSPEIRGLLPDVDFDRLKRDEIIVRTVGNRMVVSGCRGGGTLWAVYTLLQEHMGVEFYSYYETDIPRAAEFTMPQVNIRYAPVFTERNTFFYDTWRNPRFSLRLRNNSGDLEGMEDWGALPQLAVGHHSFDRLIPAEKYLATHPEFFSLREGVRVGGQLKGQLCLTNPELAQELIKNLLAEIRKYPERNIAAVSQNDNMFPCQCENCRAADKMNGGPSGTLIKFVNQAAEAVEKEFPGYKIETFAYQYTVGLPAPGIKPRSNVIVRLCSIGCNFAAPLNSDGNADFRNQLLGWGKIAEELSVWNYVANFPNQMVPFPNFSFLAADLRAFAANRVTSVLQQGSWNNGFAADLAVPHTYLIAQLVWNPSLDPDKVLDRFLGKYYREGAPYIKQYIMLMEKEVRKNGYWLGCFSKNNSWLSREAILDGYKLMRQAEEATAAGNPEIAERVRLAASPVKCVMLERSPYLRLPPEIDLRALLQETLAVIDRSEMMMYSEDRPISEYRGVLTEKVENALNGKKEAAAPASSIAAELRNSRYAVVEENFFNTSGKIINDSAAGNGRAVQLPCTVYSWDLQYQHNIDSVPLWPGRYRIFVTARADGKMNENRAFEIGYYNLRTKKQESKSFYPKDVIGDTYKDLEAGTFELSPDTYIYLAPMRNPDLNSLYIDRLIIIPVR